MTQIRLKYVHEFTDRHGKVRRYVRLPGGKRIPLHGRPGSAEFMAAYQAALDGIATPAAKMPIGASRTLRGTIDAAIVGWYGHESFTSLARTSRDTRRQSLEAFRQRAGVSGESYGSKPIAGLKAQHIATILAGMKPGSARQMLYALKALTRFALLAGLIADDPAAALKPPRKMGKSNGIHSWTEDEIAAYRAHHAIGGTPRLALELALNTAARRSDLIQIGPQHIRGGLFTYTQQKTGSSVAMPVHPDLLAVLAASPTTHALFLVTSTGSQFSPNGLGNRFREWSAEAGLPGCSLHGLRKAQARRLAEAGCSAHEIASITGHQTLAEVQRYADAADRGRMAKAAMATVSAAFGKAK